MRHGLLAEGAHARPRMLPGTRWPSRQKARRRAENGARAPLLRQSGGRRSRAPTRRDDRGRFQSPRRARPGLREAKFAEVQVFLVRTKHAIREMAAVGRVWESLRLERKARMRAVVLAVQTGRRAVQGRGAIELNPGLG